MGSIIAMSINTAAGRRPTGRYLRNCQSTFSSAYEGYELSPSTAFRYFIDFIVAPMSTASGGHRKGKPVVSA